MSRLSEKHLASIGRHAEVAGNISVRQYFELKAHIDAVEAELAALERQNAMLLGASYKEQLNVANAALAEAQEWVRRYKAEDADVFGAERADLRDALEACQEREGRLREALSKADYYALGIREICQKVLDPEEDTNG